MKKKIMSKLFYEVLDKKQKEVFLDLRKSGIPGILSGGTAIALQLKHRRSFDFDIFFPEPLKKSLILKVNKVFPKEKIQVLVDSEDELTFLSEKTKITYLYFPFPPLYKTVPTQSLSLFSLPDLASNKAYSIGRRGIYRDYVDIFFLLKSGIDLKKIVNDSQKRFSGNFNEKLFLGQLVYFADLKDLVIEYIDKKYTPSQIRSFLEKEVRKYTQKRV